MKKIIKITDFFWILFFVIKLSVKKSFFLKKRNPDLYHADNLGFFNNQSDARYVPIFVLWDVLKISRIIYNLNRTNFVSIYLRGGIATGNFTKSVSDLDIILVSKNTDLCEPSINFITKNIKQLSRKYSKIDITVVEYKKIKNNSIDSKTRLILNLQSAHLIGERLKIDNKIYKNDPQLWSFFSSFLSQQVNKNEIFKLVEEIDNYTEEDKKVIIQQIIKTAVRGVFEQVCRFGPVYTKNLIHIKKIYNIKKQSLNDLEKKRVSDCLDLIELFNQPIKAQEDTKKLKALLANILSFF